jgi:hypothetical protein
MRAWLFASQRIPETEAMATEEEAAEYTSVVAAEHIDRIDNQFVDRVLSWCPACL